MTSVTWAAREMRNADFGDARLNKRLCVLLEQMSANPTATIPQACGAWKNVKAAYRFFDSDHVSPQKIRDAHHDALLFRLPKDEMILAIQDTTILDLSSKHRMEGLGPIDHTENKGLIVHSVLAANAQGVPHGLLWQQVWARDRETKGEGKNCRKRPQAEKESQKWLTGLEKTEWMLPETRPVVFIGDREADMFPVFAAPRRPKTYLLIRAAYNRRVSEEANKLHEALALAPISGEYSVGLRSREGRPAREAVMSVRFVEVTLVPPSHLKGDHSPVKLTAIEAFESQPPEETTPLHWILLTTVPVPDFAKACTCLEWYRHRWLIEQYHRTLKSGCQIEALQLQTATRFAVVLALYCIVAWRLLWLTYEAHQTPEAPCSTVLKPHEWQALYCHVHRTPVPPPDPPTFRDAIRWIAALGGFLGRKGDGEPGVQTLWRGFQRLTDIADTWKLLHPPITYG